MWTEEREAQLTQLWADGFSASECAALLGGFSHCADGGRSAVIGKVHRLGLAGRHVVVRKHVKRKHPRGRHTRHTPQGFVLLSARMPPEPFVPLPEPVIPPHERKRLVDLEDGDCRYPIGDPKHDPDFAFCGRPKALGISYCEAHAHITFASPQSRSAERQRWAERKKHLKLVAA